MQGKLFLRHSQALVHTHSNSWAEVAFVVDRPGKQSSPQLGSLLPTSVPTAPLGQRGKQEQAELAWAREKWIVMQWW